MTDLDRLIEAVEGGANETLPWRQVFGWDDTLNADAAHKGSFDAALSLKEALLPGAECDINLYKREFVVRISYPHHAEGYSTVNLSSALLLAVLKAYRETRG